MSDHFVVLALKGLSKDFRSFNLNLFPRKSFSSCFQYSKKFDIISHNFNEKPKFSGHYFNIFKTIKHNFKIYINEPVKEILL